MSNRLYKFLDSDGLSKLINELDARYSIRQGSEQLAGLTKLYSTLGNNTDGAMTQKAVTDLLSHVYTFKGSVKNFGQLPINKNTGDVFNILETDENYPNIVSGDNVAWNGTEWFKIALGIDLSGYLKTTDTYVKSAVVIGHQLIVTTSVGTVNTFNISSVSTNLVMPVNYIATCEASGYSEIKDVYIKNFSMINGVRLMLIFKHDDMTVDSNISIKVNSYKSIPVSLTYYKNIETFAGFKSNILYEFVYDGVNWLLIA